MEQLNHELYIKKDGEWILVFSPEAVSGDFVPYTGAEANVNLGDKNISANRIISTGLAGTGVRIAKIDSEGKIIDGGVMGDFVPYTGATKNLNLGIRSIISQLVQITGLAGEGDREE